MKIIPRYAQSLVERWLFRNKAIILYGARQVGKTTLARQVAALHDPQWQYLQCEQTSVQQLLGQKDAEVYRRYFGAARIIVLDEAQKVEDIGTIIKIMVDMLPEYQIIATGSSSFDLANTLNEPLTGRHITITLYPFSFRELYGQHLLIGQAQIPERLVLGSYPEIVAAPDVRTAQQLLTTLSGDYLYKDIFTFETVKQPALVTNLLKLLALQVGNEVNLNSLATVLHTTRVTVERYIHLLEQAFVIYRLRSYSTNPRKEISRGFKVYFYDLGVRNSIIGDFTLLENRSDAGALWENFCINERMKKNSSEQSFVQAYFWRTYSQSEVDYVEVDNTQLSAFEYKLHNRKQQKKVSAAFIAQYQPMVAAVISLENFLEFV
jgi:uncharacterized protein